MLYLIKSNDYLKIGYTDNLKQRIKSYKTTNPSFEVLDTMEGTKNNEIKIHSLLKEYKYQTEWFYNKPEVLQVWNDFKKYGIGDLSQKVEVLESQMKLLESAVQNI